MTGLFGRIPGSRWRSGIAVAAAAAAVYGWSVGNGFAYDDVAVLLGDPRIADPGRWLEFVTRGYWWGAESEMGIWRPLTSLSFAVDWILSGGSPAWLHAVNVALHAAASVAAWALLRRWFSPGGALVGGLLFAVHPVHVEAVANVVGRGELLAALFVLVAIRTWTGGGDDRRSPGPGPDQVGRTPALPPGRIAGVALLFALGLLSKETALVLPALLVVGDLASGRWAWNRSAVRRYLRARGWALAAVVAVAPAYLAGRWAVLGGFAPERPHPAAEVLTSRADLLLTALQAWPHYLRLLAFPRTLLADYGPRILLPATGWTPLAVAGLVIVVAVVGGGVLALRGGSRRASAGLLWFPVAVLPVSNLAVTVGVLVAERTLYLPSFAVAMAVAGGVELLPRLTPARRRAAVAAAAAALVLLAARSVARVPEWRSTASIFRALERDAPHSYRAAWYRARVARSRGETERAARLYARAMELWPYRARLIVESAAVALERGRIPDVRRLAAHAVRVDPGSVPAHRLRAAAAWDMGDTAAALAAARAGLAVEPTDSLLAAIRRQAGATGRDPDEPPEGRERP